MSPRRLLVPALRGAALSDIGRGNGCFAISSLGPGAAKQRYAATGALEPATAASLRRRGATLGPQGLVAALLSSDELSSFTRAGTTGRLGRETLRARRGATYQHQREDDCTR